MKSRIYTGEIQHARLAPAHRFRYPLYLYAFDLDELETLDRELRGFGYNRFSPVSLHDRDYLREGPESIREKLDELLAAAGCTGVARVELLTAARYFNYVFNPVCFYYCYDDAGSVRCMLAEVNNTFGEKHVYLLDRPSETTADGTLHYEADKAFHVSPFYDMKGRYQFRFAPLNGSMEIHVDKEDAQGVHFTSCLSGSAVPLKASTLARTLFRYPLNAALTMPRILWQAARLHYRRKLPVQSKPEASHPMTLRKAPATAARRTWRNRLHQQAVMRVLGRIQKGHLRVDLPDGRQQTFGDPSEEAVSMSIQSWDFFTKVFHGADVGFGESWTDGDFQCDDLTALLNLLVRNQDCTDERSLLGRVGQAADRVRHRLNRNSVERSRKNIQEHYDLSNDFFSAWLDPSMTYSCALFEHDEQHLEDAQRNKIQALINKVQIKPGDQVLEIGCGWGSFAIEAVRQTGCRVTGLTLSEKQKEFAERRIAEAGLSDRIDIQLLDYRHAQGQYDRIVSIEMLEAVGDEYFEGYFAACSRLLKPGGMMGLQVITIPEERYETYRNSCDWIQKYIFPGGLLPSIQRLHEAIGDSSDLAVAQVSPMGIDYATTLNRWRQEFEKNWNHIGPLGFDEPFRRMWNYYLSYCEAGFANRYIDVVQMVLAREAVETPA